MLIIAVDPGNVSGMDFYMKRPDGRINRFSHENPGLFEVVDQLRAWRIAIAGWQAPVHIAVEKYTMTSGSGPKTAQPLALMIMGAVEVVAADLGWTHHYFTSGECKGRADNATLKRLGWWEPTKDGHINDARRVTLSCMAHVFPEEFASLMGL